jgi:hypothetical protein
MANVKNFEVVQSVLGRWHPEDLVFIERLEYFADCSKEHAKLKIVALFQRQDIVRKKPVLRDEGFCRVHLLCGGIRKFCLKDFGYIPTQIVGFDIVDISDRGWEGVKFKVEDYEEHRISFLCDTIEVLFCEENLVAL